MSFYHVISIALRAGMNVAATSAGFHLVIDSFSSPVISRATLPALPQCLRCFSRRFAFDVTLRAVHRQCFLSFQPLPSGWNEMNTASYRELFTLRQIRIIAEASRENSHSQPPVATPRFYYHWRWIYFSNDGSRFRHNTAALLPHCRHGADISCCFTLLPHSFSGRLASLRPFSPFRRVTVLAIIVEGFHFALPPHYHFISHCALAMADKAAGWGYRYHVACSHLPSSRWGFIIIGFTHFVFFVYCHTEVFFQFSFSHFIICIGCMLHIVSLLHEKPEWRSFFHDYRREHWLYQ